MARFVEPYSGPDHRVRRALSLPELLVVVAIIALLLAMLLPGLGGAREQVRRVFCANNLQQWGKALQLYRYDYDDYIPTEGYLGGPMGDDTVPGYEKPGTWYNTLPQYLGLPPYKDTENVNVAIKEKPAIHVWICPSKNLTKAFKSGTGKNQFHYAMNEVLDGVGSSRASRDTPGFPDAGDEPLRANQFLGHPDTVYMFDITPNSPCGNPRDVATMYQIDTRSGQRVAKFHGDYANILYLNGAVTHGDTDDLVADKDFVHGAIQWCNPRFYWGYVPK
jgi:prepilin-type N-terminal cleavage/methylation domain-containing protein